MLGANHTTTTTAAAFIPSPVWAKEISRAFEANLILADKVKRRDMDVASFGSSIQIPKLSNLAANDKIANTEVVLQAPTETYVTLTINQHKHVAFLIEDITKAQSKYDLLTEYSEKSGYALKKAIDSSLANLVTGFSQSVGTYNTAVASSAFQDAVETLNGADVPTEDRVWVLHPETVSETYNISDFVRYDGTGYAGNVAEGRIGGGSGGMNNANGKIGRIYGADAYMTTQIPKSGNNTSNIYMHKEALCLAMQKNVITRSEYVLQYLGDLVVAQTLYGVTEVRDEAGLELRS